MRAITSFGLCAWAICLGLSVPASAQSGVSLSRAVFVERVSDSGERQVGPASTLRKGDTVVLLVEWQAPKAEEKFIVSSPIPKSLVFKRSSLREQSVSVDGGRNWGRIGTLKIRDGFGLRLASAEDVTHLRWQVQPSQFSENRGRITYSAIVR